MLGVCRRYIALTLFLGSSLFASTKDYLVQHSLDDIKYSLKLFDTTFEHKTLLDKAIDNEHEGFFGYFACDCSYRVYQDVIRMIFEEVLGLSVPKEFHFMAVPLYPKRTIRTLDAVERAFFSDRISLYAFSDQCVPFNIALYANHKSLGFCPMRAFEKKPAVKFDDLMWLLHFLEMDETLFDQAKELALDAFGENDHLLLQFFDRSHEYGHERYAFADAATYPASLTGAPFENASISEYLTNPDKALPAQFFLLLDDAGILNVQSPVSILRYAKVQPSKLKNYEEALWQLVRQASYNPDRAQEYTKKYKEKI